MQARSCPGFSVFDPGLDFLTLLLRSLLSGRESTVGTDLQSSELPLFNGLANWKLYIVTHSKGYFIQMH
jgi:hypothetical protein